MYQKPTFSIEPKENIFGSGVFGVLSVKSENALDGTESFELDR
jgi:hypothetical protein